MTNQFERNHTASAIRNIRKILHQGRSEHTYCEEELMPKKSSWEWLIWVAVVILCLLMLHGCAYGYTEQDAIKSVIGEAEGEPQEGKEAVACAMHYRGYLTGVYGLKADRVIHHKYSYRTYVQAKRAVEMAEDKEYCEGLVNGAQYWASTTLDHEWIKKMASKGYVHTATIGNQMFFRKDS